MGEKMSEDEIEAMCKVGKIINSKGKVNCEDFIRLMMSVE